MSGDGVDDVIVYTFDELDVTSPLGQDRADELVQIFDSVSGAEIEHWTFPGRVSDRGFDRTRVDLMTRDITGDGELDMLAEVSPVELAGEHERPVALLPSRLLRSHRIPIFSERGWSSRTFRLLPDVDGDGADDVLSFAHDAGSLRILDHDALEIWSVPWRAQWNQETLGRQRDLDGDGLVDIASIDTDGTGGSVIRLFLSGASGSGR